MRVAVFQSRRVAVAALLGFSSGVPLLLTGPLLAARLSHAGVDVATIGALAAVGLPYTFKWTWAPLLDRYRWPFLGRRRGWLLVLQLALALAILALGAVDPVAAPGSVAVAALAVAALSASQDVVVDALNSDALHVEERAAGSAAYLMGYRAAMLLTGIAILAFAGVVGWLAAYATCAAALAVGIVGTLLAEEPAAVAAPPTLADAVWQPLARLIRRPGVGWVLGFVALYRFGEHLVLGMIYPFLHDVGHFSLAEVAVGYQAVGFAGTLCGGVVGGALVARLGVRRCLVGLGVLMAVTNLGWLGIAAAGHALPLLALAAFADAAAGAMGSGAFVAFLMARCDREVSATQLAILTSLSSVGGRLLGFAAGLTVRAYGWPLFWVATTVVALPALALVARLPADEPRPRA